MNERIKELRNYYSLTQDAFAKKLGVTGAAVSRIEKGERCASNQVITSICREWSVNENWLRDGSGSMFVELSQSELAARAVGNLLKNDSEFVQKVMIGLGSLSANDWKLVEDWINVYLVQGSDDK